MLSHFDQVGVSWRFDESLKLIPRHLYRGLLLFCAFSGNAVFGLDAWAVGEYSSFLILCNCMQHHLAVILLDLNSTFQPVKCLNWLNFNLDLCKVVGVLVVTKPESSWSCKIWSYIGLTFYWNNIIILSLPLERAWSSLSFKMPYFTNITAIRWLYLWKQNQVCWMKDLHWSGD